MQDVWVPFEIVSCDASRPALPNCGIYPITTNGLGAGNNLVEATLHGLYEIIERDALTLAIYQTKDDAGARELDLHNFTSARVVDLIDRVRQKASLRLWDVSSEIPVTVIKCQIDGSHPAIGSLPASEGYGCHSNHEVAISRAITEAAQSRLTHISGAREDRARHLYRKQPMPTSINTDARWAGKASIAFPMHQNEDFQDLSVELDWLLSALSYQGFDSVIVVDLSHTDIGIPVVKVLIPGLEGPVFEYVNTTRQLSLTNPQRVFHQKGLQP